MENQKTDVEQLILDTLLGTEPSFSTGGTEYRLYPSTLGKDMILTPLMREIGITETLPEELLSPLAYNAVTARRNEVLRVVALHTMARKQDMTDEKHILDVMYSLGKGLEDDELAALLVIIVRRQGNLARIIRESGIAEDKERMRELQKAKGENPNSVQFGGMTIYGRLIDEACHRYGWTLDYVLWGISSANLQLMMTDQRTSIYLTDAELKNVGSEDETVIDGDNPNNNRKLHDLLNKKT